MKKILFFLLVCFAFIQHIDAQVVAGRMNEVFLKTDLDTLSGPWEILWGPDDSLWITESKGYTVRKLHPNGGNARIILNVMNGSTFLGNTSTSDSTFNMKFHLSSFNPQGGFAGMAIHPEFKTNPAKRFVYVGYVWKYDSTRTGARGVFYRNTIVRFTYNTSSGRLQNPVALCDTLPGSNDHNSQRMIIAPVNGIPYLFYASGDMGGGQFANTARPIKSQDSASYEGKILRFNLEPDGDAGLLDRWIPDDNPYNGTSSRVPGESAVWASGMRNNQGFAYDSVRNILYGSSHGPFSDDEIDIIERGRNYGHPLVVGRLDGNYNNSRVATRWENNNSSNPATTAPLIVSEAANAATIGPSFKEAIYSAFPAPQATINNLYLTSPNNAGWPSEGWSGMEIYKGSQIPGWKNSLFMASLKEGRILRTQTNAAGTAMVPINGFDTVSYFGGVNRFRDLAFSPNGRDIYIVMDSSTTSSGPSQANPVVPDCRGCVQKYAFLGYQSIGDTSRIPRAIPIASGMLNQCEQANFIVINATNNNIWVPITDTLGNVIAEIRANGNNLDTVWTSFFVKNGVVREVPTTRTLYLNRNVTITPKVQPSSAVSIRLYILAAEYDSLRSARNSLGQVSGVSTLNDIGIYKNDDDCGNTLLNLTQAASMTRRQTFGAQGYYLQANINSFSTFYFAPTSRTLPIHLLTFNGNLVGEDAALQWSVDRASTPAQFELERSVNGRDFVRVASIEGVSGTVKKDYQYRDAQITALATDIVYYRLYMTDLSGEKKYSNIVRIYLPLITKGAQVLPNPTAGDATLLIYAKAAGRKQYTLVDQQGRVIWKRDVQVQVGQNQFVLPMEQLNPGMYYIQVDQQMIKVIRQ
jgi:trimeric autotransporter adhesin